MPPEHSATGDSGERVLAGKTVVVGITGGIAAYKAVEVVSRLRRLGADVHVVMTRAATRFVTPLTLQTISGNAVVTSMFSRTTRWNVEHVALADRADLLLVVPATANVVGKVAAGVADDFLTTTIMACRAPVVFCPAMNFRMYENPIFQANVARLEDLGYRFVPPEAGWLAEGTVGVGRLPDPSLIVDRVVQMLGGPSAGGGDLAGCRVLVTAGPTWEMIDPVRFISNPSSGKMGYALARAARMRGAAVVLVSGPVALPPPEGVELVPVTSAEDMFGAVMDRLPGTDLVLKAAAVGDWRPRLVHPSKVKKEQMAAWVLELDPTPDILAEVGRRKGKTVVVGFAAETDDIERHAREKIAYKNLDLLVVNDVSRPGVGFASDDNQVTLYWPDGSSEDLPAMRKAELAHRILDRVVPVVRARRGG
ncbi:MAG: bifunctional phosphopantothenoylcysteine decarboxylase/phosphopantothenate--cysteine ligase CoaBC [Bacillota bacterium]|nr:bifunctional phosphopantothenoylcysteine decarboxylase/phosphopantothenate--cysteine ligase CoaBC [Bacillota bacterium]